MPSKLHTLVPLVAFAAPAIASAAVVVDPTLVSGPDAIDPAGFEDVDTSFGTDQSLLEGLTGFAAIQDFTGFTALGPTNPTNTFSFTDPLRSDVQFSLITPGNTAGDEEADTGAALLSSPGAAFQLRDTDGDDMGAVGTTLRMDFGTYNDTTDVFVGAAAGVDAAGFMINNLNGNARVTATFFTDAGVQLFTTTEQQGNSSNPDLYVGFATTTDLIGYIDVNFRVPGSGNRAVGIDDLGYTAVIPEAASAGALSLGLLALSARRRRN